MIQITFHGWFYPQLWTEILSNIATEREGVDFVFKSSIKQRRIRTYQTRYSTRKTYGGNSSQKISNNLSDEYDEDYLADQV
jgi:hypothetical protein